jgi:putative transposase
MRKKPLANNEYYHIYNRGVDKREVFSDDRDYVRFLLSIDLLNDEKDGLMIMWRDYQRCVKNANLNDFLKLNFRKRERLVDIISFCLMSNHYHFVLKQNVEKGIERFLQKLGTSYTKYFNKKYQRNGSLFQGTFKSSHISSNGLLLRMAVYASCNSEIHKVSPANNYPWCSFAVHLGRQKSDIVNNGLLSEHFKSGKDFEEYANENILDFQERKQDQEMFLDSLS